MGDEILTPGGAQSSGWAQAGVSHFSFPQASLLGPYSSGHGGPPYLILSRKPPKMPSPLALAPSLWALLSPQSDS